MITKYDSNDYILAVLGSKIKTERIINKYTQKEFASLAGISLKTLCNIESGKDFSVDSLIRIMKVLNLIDRFEKLINENSDVSKQRYKKSTKQSDWKWGE